MPSANRITTPIGVDIDALEGRYAPLEDYTVSFETFKEDADPAPFFVGLPDDRCQCAHWGFVTSGQLTFRYADHEETYVEGDAYFAPAGHLPVVTAGTSTVEFSLTPELEATMAVVGANLEKAGMAS
ncbi:MAG: cupin domain-containing protein [Marmoricola sp.]